MGIKVRRMKLEMVKLEMKNMTDRILGVSLGVHVHEGALVNRAPQCAPPLTSSSPDLALGGLRRCP